MKISKILNTNHRTKWEDALWKEICDHLANTKSEKGFKRLIGKLLSREEKRTIVNRVAVLALIKTGKSYSEIGELLWVSPVTISTIKKNFWDESPHYKNRHFFKKEKKSTSEIITRTKKSFLDELLNVDLWELIKNPPRPAGMGIVDRSKK